MATYLVLYDRSRFQEFNFSQTYTRGPKLPKEHMLYEKAKELPTKAEAYRLAQRAMYAKPEGASSDPIVVQQNGTAPGEGYIVAGFFPERYFLSDSEGTLHFPLHEVKRCSESELEAVIDSIAERRPDTIRWGLELKIPRQARTSPWKPGS